ncbi:MAG: aldehyde dehydrogenase family protein, partial [Myxococcales bacterium]|nr:aldehyde dehydrogenase family protein [Myxococcales bacterium]
FNFPVAVWSWNAFLAAVCGDVCVWKPSPRTPLSAIAATRICNEALRAGGFPEIFFLFQDAGTALATRLVNDRRIPLISFTGSTEVGRQVAERVARRLGRSLLELGGNNAAIVLDDADLDIAVRAVLFGAFGTAGQRCTSTRRLFLTRGVSRPFLERLLQACAHWRVGDPREPGVLCGPLIRPTAVDAYRRALERGIALGGRVLHGGRALERPGFFVEPAVVLAPSHARFEVAWEETFAPILWVFEVDSLEEAIAANNAVSQGLSSALFTTSLRATWRFLGPDGSDCGLANVNTSTSGAEIGGAFGGEKDTGGGREAGSDAWKAYMRRQTVTLNHGTTLPLAQGIQLGWTGG